MQGHASRGWAIPPKPPPWAGVLSSCRTKAAPGGAMQLLSPQSRPAGPGRRPGGAELTQGVERKGACCGVRSDALPTVEVIHLRPGLGLTSFPSLRAPRNGRNLALPTSSYQ
ncbi:hypothetical protein VULLAG_LOCUS18041 [Vulpes lagopus]